MRANMPRTSDRHVNEKPFRIALNLRESAPFYPLDLQKIAKRVRPPGAVVLQVDPQSAAERAGLKPGDLVTELDGTPVRDAADLQLRLALLKDRRSRRIRRVAPGRRGDGARREEREPAARYSSRNQASRNTSA